MVTPETSSNSNGPQLTSATLPDAAPSTASFFLERLRESTALADELHSLKESGALVTIIPEFAETWGPRGEQHPKWHPEGNVWIHTLMVVEALPPHASLALKLAAVFHDIGKPPTFFPHPLTGDISFPGHAHVGADMFRRVIGPRLGIDEETIKTAAEIIEHHMLMHDFFKPQLTSPEFQQHILQLPWIEELIEMQHADVYGTGISAERKIECSYRTRLKALLSANL